LLVSVNVNRNAHPHTVFAVLQNEDGESVNVQIHFEASTNVDNLTLGVSEFLCVRRFQTKLLGC
jgi:hypothetical protein